MQAFSKDNNGIKYLLTVIDVFSKFVWIVPLKRKTRQEVEARREVNENKVWRNLYPKFGGVTLIPKFSIGDND